MRDVAIVGSATTLCQPRWLTKSLGELFQMALSLALQNAKLPLEMVQAAYAGIYNDIFARQAIPECTFVGNLKHMMPVMRISNGGATGIYTFEAAWQAIASGFYDVVLCIGGEKATDTFDFMSMTQTPEVVQTIAWSWDPLFERDQGATAADSYALVILSYLDKYHGDLAMPVRTEILRIMCEQAKLNPNAQRRDEVVTPDLVEASPWVIEPAYKKLETCVYTEGAACLILAADGVAQEICTNAGHDPVWVSGLGYAMEPYWWGTQHPHKLPGRIESDYVAAQKAYKMAEVGPEDIDLVELHDAFLPQLMITLAEMGFVGMGHANDLIEKRVMADENGDGEVIVNPSGGLIFGGHFVGGSNMFSMESAVRELRKRDLRRALIHGTGASSAQHGGAVIVERRAS